MTLSSTKWRAGVYSQLDAPAPVRQSCRRCLAIHTVAYAASIGCLNLNVVISQRCKGEPKTPIRLTAACPIRAGLSVNLTCWQNCVLNRSYSPLDFKRLPVQRMKLTKVKREGLPGRQWAK